MASVSWGASASGSVRQRRCCGSSGFRRQRSTERLPGGTHRAVVARVLDHLAEAGHSGAQLLGAGHRVVHGGERFTSSIRVDDAVMAAVRSFSHLAPLHNPANLAGIEAVRAVLPDLPQVAVFDTAFHQTMPPCAFRYAVPEEWYTRYGVRRYGFHGISHRFVSEQAAVAAGPAARRAPAGHRPPGKRVQCDRGARRRVGGYDNGAHPAGRAGDGDPLRRCRSGPAQLPGRPDRHECRRAHRGAEPRQRACGAVRRRQRHAHRRSCGRGRKRAGQARPRGLRVPARPRRSPGWWSGCSGSTRWFSPAASGKTAPSSAAWCSASLGFLGLAEDARPTPTMAGGPGGASASPARSWRSSCRRTRSC